MVLGTAPPPRLRSQQHLERRCAPAPLQRPPPPHRRGSRGAAPTHPSRPKKRKNKQPDKSYDEPKRDIVLSGKRNIVGVEGKTDISEDYDKFAEIPPFTVKADPTIPLNKEDAPWLRLKRS